MPLCDSVDHVSSQLLDSLFEQPASPERQEHIRGSSRECLPSHECVIWSASVKDDHKSVRVGTDSGV